MENENNGGNNSFIKKIIEFVKKNPALSGTVGTVILYVLGIFLIIILLAVIIYIVISSLTLLWGTPTNWITKGEYKEYSIEDFQTQDFSLGSCYQAQVASEGDEKTPLGMFFDSIWERAKSSLSAGINDKCEFIKVVTGEIEDAENKYKDYGLKISSGLVTSTIIYQYSSVVVSEGEERVAPGSPEEVLEDIVNENLITRAKIKSIVDNMILKESYWYYNCNKVTCRVNSEGVEETDESSSMEFEIKSGKQCTRNFYFNVKFSREKYFTYLRYGEEAAIYYETAINHNESTEYSCDECYKKWNDDNYNMVQIDVSKYLSVANTKTNEADNIIVSLSEKELEILQKEINESKRVLKSLYKKPSLSLEKEFTYKSGIIYNDFKDFKSSFDKGKLIEDVIFTPKTIELTIESIDSYEDNVNDIYGIDENSLGTGRPNLSYTGEERAQKQCPTEEACNCSNGNLTPADSSDGGETSGSSSASCKYVLSAPSVMIRLYGCTDPVLSSPQVKMPGGAYQGTVKGKSVWIANEAISFEQYVKYGIMAEPTLSKMKVGGLAVHMVLYQSYALAYIERHPELIQENGEIYIENGSCMQNYNESLLTNSYAMKYFDMLNEAYDIAKNLIVADASGVIPFFQYNSTFSKSLEGIDGDIAKVYNENVLNYGNKPGPQLSAASATLQDCLNSSSESGDFNADEGSTTNIGSSGYYNLMSPKKGIFGSFPYHDSAAPNDTSNRQSITMDPKWKSANLTTISKDCGNGLSMKWTVHKLAKSAFSTVQEKMCLITTTGIDGIIYSPSEITFSGPLNVRYVSNTKTLSLHSWGIAIDVNSSAKYTVNGKTYTPYGRKKTGGKDIGLQNYLSFVNALGSESDKRNVNYILWIKIFKPAGFRWGGNWGRNGDSSTYDGMHFEIDWRQTK